MSRQNQRLARLAPGVAAELEELQAVIRNLGEQIGAALAAQAEQQRAERAAEPERTQDPEPITNTVDVPSATIGYRAAEVARRLSIHQQTLWSWIRQGRFPPGIRIGAARTIWTEQQIAQWLAQQRANPGKRRPLPRERL